MKRTIAEILFWMVAVVLVTWWVVVHSASGQPITHGNGVQIFPDETLTAISSLLCKPAPALSSAVQVRLICNSSAGNDVEVSINGAAFQTLVRPNIAVNWSGAQDFLNTTIFDGNVTINQPVAVNAAMSFSPGTLLGSPTDVPTICGAGVKSSLYYDTSLNQWCFCDGTNWCKVSSPATCTSASSCG